MSSILMLMTVKCFVDRMMTMMMMKLLLHRMMRMRIRRVMVMKMMNRIRRVMVMMLTMSRCRCRYLGDLFGGQMMSGMATKSLGLEQGKGVEFYNFQDITDVKVKAVVILRTSSS